MSRQERWQERKHIFVKYSFGAWLFLTAYVGLILINGLTSTALKQTNPGLVSLLTDVRWLLFALLLFKVMACSHYTKSRLCAVLLCVMLLFLGFVRMHSIIMLQNVLLLVAAKDIPFPKIVRYGLAAFVTAFGMVFALELIGILPDTMFVRSGASAQRHTLGFGHPNTLGIFVLTICLLWMVLRFSKLCVWDYAGWFGMGLLLLLVADSRTSALMIWMMVLATACFRRWNGLLVRHAVLRRLIFLVFPLCMVLSIVLCVTYNGNNAVMHFINSVATNRLKWGHLMYGEYGFHMFGQPIEFVSNLEAQLTGARTHILDNSYMRLPVYFGLIATALYVGWFCMTMRHALRLRDWAVVVSLLILCVYGLTEAHQINVLYNFALFKGAELLTPEQMRQTVGGQRRSHTHGEK